MTRENYELRQPSTRESALPIIEISLAGIKKFVQGMLAALKGKMISTVSVAVFLVACNSQADAGSDAADLETAATNNVPAHATGNNETLTDEESGVLDAELNAMLEEAANEAERATKLAKATSSLENFLAAVEKGDISRDDADYLELEGEARDNFFTTLEHAQNILKSRAASAEAKRRSVIAKAETEAAKASIEASNAEIEALRTKKALLAAKRAEDERYISESLERIFREGKVNITDK